MRPMGASEYTATPVGGDCASIGTAALQVFANSSSSPHQRTVACRASSSLGARIAVPRDTGPVGILAPHVVVHGPHLSRRASHGVSTPTRGCVRLVPSPTSAHDLIHSNWTAAAQPTTARIIQCEPIAALQLFRRQAKGRGGRPRILPQRGCAPHVVPNHIPPRGAARAALAPCGPSVASARFRGFGWGGCALPISGVILKPGAVYGDRKLGTTLLPLGLIFRPHEVSCAPAVAPLALAGTRMAGRAACTLRSW